MKKLLLAGIIVTTSLFAQTPAMSSQNQIKNMQHKQLKRHYRINRNNFMSLIRNVGITPVQRVKIRTILTENRKHMIYRNALIASIKNGKFNKTIFIKIREKVALHNIEKRANLIEKIYAILTPAQKTKLEALMNAKRKK